MAVTLTSKVLRISRQMFDTLVADANNVLDDIKGELENDSELSNIIGTSSNFNISIGLTLKEKIEHLIMLLETKTPRVINYELDDISTPDIITPKK